MRSLSFKLAVSLLAVSARSLPAAEVAKPTVDLSIYQHVDHVGWVAKDSDSVVAYWEKLGLRGIRREGVRDFPTLSYRGKTSPVSLKLTFANIGDGGIEWIQPLEGKSVYNEFLSEHGDGIQHLAFSVPSSEHLDQQIEYFKARGVGVIQSGTWKGKRGTGRFIYLDTGQRGGGITLELSLTLMPPLPEAPRKQETSTLSTRSSNTPSWFVTSRESRSSTRVSASAACPLITTSALTASIAADRANSRCSSAGGVGRTSPLNGSNRLSGRVYMTNTCRRTERASTIWRSM